MDSSVPTAETREAFFPPLRLKRSKESHTASILYSASTSSQFGRGSRLAIYFDREQLPRPLPDTIDIMIYLGAPPGPARGHTIYLLGLDGKQPNEEPVARYSQQIGHAEQAAIGTVYLPLRIFSDGLPQQCWLDVNVRNPGQNQDNLR